MGLENYALIGFLFDEKIPCQITICDARPKKELNPARVKFLENKKEITWKLGRGYDKDLSQFDMVVRAPGYALFSPELAKAKKAGADITSAMKLFFAFCPGQNIIGVTGTKGKGTTSSLIYRILKQAGKKVFLGGNIGVAPFAFLKKIKKSDWVVLELSSFQLEDMTVSPRVAVITNFFRDHLTPADPNNPNYHPSLKKYQQAKLNILKWQGRSDWAVLNEKIKKKTEAAGQGRKIYFAKSEMETKLIGEHNKENVAAAVAVAEILKIKKDIVTKAVKSFVGLEHRLEFVKKINGVEYYDDSFATNPDSTITALKSFSQPIVILLGGADKGADFKSLAKEVKKKVKFAVLLHGQATPRIEKELKKIGFKNMQTVRSMEEAVSAAKKQAQAGDVVLLSTACASFGMFQNYKQRGDLFKEEI